jgi:hypothetical protein
MEVFVGFLSYKKNNKFGNIYPQKMEYSTVETSPLKGRGNLTERRNFS